MIIRGLAVWMVTVGALATIAMVMAILPAWIDFSASLIASGVWCHRLETHDSVAI